MEEVLLRLSSEERKPLLEPKHHHWHTALSNTRYILSGKIGRKILPLKLFSYFLIINTGLVQVHYSHFWALWTPGGLWGALGWFGGVWQPQTCHFLSQTNSSLGMDCFGL